MANKPKSEKQSRAELLGWARKYGCEANLLKIFNRVDDLLRGCKTEEEKKAVATMGIVELHSFFGGNETGLAVNGQVVIEPPNYVPAPELPDVKFKIEK